MHANDDRIEFLVVFRYFFLTVVEDNEGTDELRIIFEECMRKSII